MQRKPLCRYCGYSMELQDHSGHDNAGNFEAWNFWCPVCGSESPLKKDKKEAYNAASEEQMKPLTFEEVKQQKAVWVESRSGNVKPMVLLDEVISKTMKETYGVVWRAWLRWPNDKQKKAVGWKDGAK